MSNESDQPLENQDPQTATGGAAEENLASAGDVEIVQADAEIPVDELSELRSKNAELEKLALRYQADLENFRKRSRAQAQEQIKYASLPLISELLESVDNLGRATDSVEADDKNAGLIEGVKMVATQISNLLEQHGCKKIEAVGHAFDPNCHQAVQMQPSDEYESNVVMTEVRPGFKLHDRVIRPSQVFVSTGPATESGE